MRLHVLETSARRWQLHASHLSEILPSLSSLPAPSLRADGMNRPYEGCGQQRDRRYVVGLRLCLNDHLNVGAPLERLGVMALFAPGNDVVMKGLEVAVGDDGNSEGGVRAPVL
jgi:hypothetical protein